MSLLIVAYPRLSEADSAWMESIRAARDRQHAIIRAHITLVFPTQTVSAEHLIGHAREIVRTTPRFPVVFRCANVVKDPLSDQTYVFLLPDEGTADLVKLHDRLYTGLLTAQRRLDVPYFPHITVGASHDPQVCRTLVDELNCQEFHLVGAVEHIDVVRYESGRVETIAQLPLR